VTGVIQTNVLLRDEIIPPANTARGERSIQITVFSSEKNRKFDAYMGYSRNSSEIMRISLNSGEE
jgi:hypothetical protein